MSSKTGMGMFEFLAEEGYGPQGDADLDDDPKPEQPEPEPEPDELHIEHDHWGDPKIRGGTPQERWAAASRIRRDRRSYKSD